jgi:hypothetical protein
MGAITLAICVTDVEQVDERCSRLGLDRRMRGMRGMNFFTIKSMPD